MQHSDKTQVSVPRADDFATQAVKTVLKKDLPGLVILDGLARGARPIELSPGPNTSRSSEE